MGFRTDLIMENEKVNLKNLPQGVCFKEETLGNAKVQILEVQNLKASTILGKPIGKYITAAIPNLGKNVSLENKEKYFLAEYIKNMLPKEGTVLVAGLGNRDITADALGIKTADYILATRHLTEKALKPLEGFRSVAVLSSGVLGQTGIESAEIISSVAEKIKPAAIIAVDALAAASVSRLGSTIQITDTGIAPGSGVQNKRAEISRDTLDIPVIALGVPTVVDSDVIVTEYGMKKAEEQGETFMVSPRDIDLVIKRGSELLSLIINLALQENLTQEDIEYLIG